MSRRPFKSEVKARSLTAELHLKLEGLSVGEGSGIPSAAVKCLDIGSITSGEGDYLVDN